MWRQVVAQSPGDNAPDTEVLRYDVGWKALNTMLKAGRSLSGNERNCAFLNVPGKRFANIAQATGLDFNDDGRVVGKVDWDHDGDLDFWITNRTGPQARFLRNNTDGANHSVQFKLQGTKCNRDAIGAKLTVTFSDDRKPRVRTVTSGGSYLSQHSPWIHLGLGSETVEIKSITVEWPGGAAESFPPCTINRRHLLIEGSGEILTQQKRPSLVSLKPSEIEVPDPTDQARIVLIQPLPIPDMDVRTREGKKAPIITGKPRLITLWSNTCPCCQEELEEWKTDIAVFKEAGLEVFAINVEEESEQARALEFFDQEKLPFTAALGGPEIGAQFDVIQRSILSRQRPLPLPSSFLIDGKGNLAVIYKGPVSAAQVAEDAQLFGKDLDRLLAAASPFPGKWLGIPKGSSPNSLAIRFAEGGFTGEAQAYLERLLTEGTDNPVFNGGSASVLLGAIYLDKGELEKAASAFAATLEIDPHHRQAAIELAGVLMTLKQPAKAAIYYLKALERRQDDPELHFNLGLARLQSGDVKKAAASFQNSVTLRPSGEAHFNLGNIALSASDFREALTQYSKALEFEPPIAPAANNLAWLLAALPDAKMRDEERALQLAQRLLTIPGERTASNLDTLAVTLAANGKFEKAITIANEAIALATKNGNTAIAQDIAKRLALYQKNTPYRE
ncbi:MAG: tetratricopeptide repeat protein [Akkermansiaceae bacterium]